MFELEDGASTVLSVVFDPFRQRGLVTKGRPEFGGTSQVAAVDRDLGARPRGDTEGFDAGNGRLRINC